eukprot:1154054-Pelagomonas_calceolata.AAC.1
MPPRKRKAPASRSGPQCLQAIAEEGQEGVPSAGAAVPEARDSRGRTKEEAINHIADEGTRGGSWSTPSAKRNSTSTSTFH